MDAIRTTAPCLVPRYTAAFVRKHPEAKLRIVEETTPILVESLRDLSMKTVSINRAAVRAC